MRYLFGLILLAASFCQGYGQIVISGAVTPEQVEAAQKQVAAGQKLLDMTKDNTAYLKVGEFQVVERRDSIKSPLLWQWTNWDKKTVTIGTTDIVKRHEVKAGQDVWIHKVRSGDTEAKDHFFPAQKEPWTWISAETPGSATLTVLANGDVGKEPVPVSNNKIVVEGQGPAPQPKPVDPPIVTPVTGLRVVFVYDPLAKLSKEQAFILASPKIEDYLKTHCSKDEKGRPAFRKWGNAVDTSLETASWQSLWTELKPKLGPLPQICIVSNLKGETFALPENEQKTLELLQQYGGK